MTFPGHMGSLPYRVRGAMGYTITDQAEGRTVMAWGRHWSCGELTVSVWIPPGYLNLD